MNELKPCPFCGSHNVFTSTDHFDVAKRLHDKDYYMSHVFCINCKSKGGNEISTDKEISRQLAVKAWNRRVEVEE